MTSQVVQELAQVAFGCRKDEQGASGWQPLQHHGAGAAFQRGLIQLADAGRPAEGSQRACRGGRQGGEFFGVEAGGKLRLDNQSVVADDDGGGHVGPVDEGHHDGSERLHWTGSTLAEGTREARAPTSAKSRNHGGLPRSGERSNLLHMIRRLALVLGISASAACSANQLAPAQQENVVDTTTMGALAGAALKYPSAYDITIGQPVRTDQTSSFDFIYTKDALGRNVLLPLHAIAGLGTTTGSNPGFIRLTVPFNDITAAPTEDYLTTDTLVIVPGDVLAARSRVACYLGVPQYAKIQIIDFDDVNKTVRFAVLSNTNCGYKNLQVGVPTN